MTRSRPRGSGKGRLLGAALVAVAAVVAIMLGLRTDYGTRVVWLLQDDPRRFCRLHEDDARALLTRLRAEPSVERAEIADWCDADDASYRVTAWVRCGQADKTRILRELSCDDHGECPWRGGLTLHVHPYDVTAPDPDRGDPRRIDASFSGGSEAPY